MSSKKQARDKTEKADVEDEKNADEYQCSGKVEVDFPGLCGLLDIKDIPAVRTKQSAPPTFNETEGGDTTVSQSEIPAEYSWSKPCLQVELENEDSLSAKCLKVSGWKVNEQIARVLQKMLPSLRQVQSLQFWQAGLSDRMVISLISTISLCSNLRVVTLEGNPLPESSYHHLLSENSILTHLSLRNNQIGDESARLLGAALSTSKSSNKNLLSLNLAFNSIGDVGAAHIAQGLRLNCALRFLSLSNNRIGDSGAAHLSTILGEFALTHEEVVERRKLRLERMQSSTIEVDSGQTPEQLPSVPSNTSLSISKGENKGISRKKEASKKDEKQAANKENPKSNKKSSDVKAPHSKGGKPGGKEKQLTAQEDQPCAAPKEEVELVEIRNPLLEESLHYKDGQLFLPGNSTLTSLNLAGNRITEKSLPLFLTTLKMQGERGGLLRLCLQRNRFPLECETYVKIEGLIALRHQRKNSSEVKKEEGQGA
ncbi:leucine-rich repeat-containing protein 71 [Echeneis naucrates]|uniref:leucine-rich repeat-containing protein 71 n=1 Tax=Echeneis naucrates TaxID=173247 RepID=UPI0011139484|nr:leucine-rich repeat-containing protein 71 [Echeneis naucrates]